MYYVFYETGNDLFFSRITIAFCKHVLERIIRDYGKLLPQNSIILENDVLIRFLENNRKELKPLNCTLFGAAIACGIPRCMEKYKAVLASDQIERFSHIMRDTIDDFKNNFTGDPRDRLNIQGILQKYETINMQDVEEILISSKKRPLDYKYEDIRRHRRSYAIKARKMRRKADAEGFVYVRSATGSQYNDFARKTRLPGLTPCDTLQGL